MLKKFSSLLFISLLITSCSASETMPDLSQINSQANISSTKPLKNSTDPKAINPAFAKQVAASLDLNKDGGIDATEAPIMIGGPNVNYVYNYDNKAFNQYPATKALTVDAIVDLMNSGATLSVQGSKLSEKNKSKIASNLAAILVKDTIGDGSKVFGYSTDIGYFTAKTTAYVRSMDASLLAKKITEQITVGQGTVNGQPYGTANGSINIMPSYVTIDGQYKSRLNFSDYSDFSSGIQIFGSHKITDAASKIVK